MERVGDWARVLGWLRKGESRGQRRMSGSETCPQPGFRQKLNSENASLGKFCESCSNELVKYFFKFEIIINLNQIQLKGQY